MALARSHVEDVEFSAEDALRSDWAFLAELYSVAIKAGATTLNVPDTVGFTTPSEFRELVKYLRTHVVGSVSLEPTTLNPEPLPPLPCYHHTRSSLAALSTQYWGCSVWSVLHGRRGPACLYCRHSLLAETLYDHLRLLYSLSSLISIGQASGLRM